MKPVKPGDTITARVEVLEVLTERNRVRLSTVCRNQRGEDVLSGEAWVMPSKTRIIYERPASSTAGARLAMAPWTWAAETMALWSKVGASLLSASVGQRRG